MDGPVGMDTVFRIFVSHVNVHQRVSSVETALNNWETRRLVHWVSTSFCPQPFHKNTMGSREEWYCGGNGGYT